MADTDNTQEAVAKGGEYWLAGILLLQGADKGYRVATVDVDDAGVDLMLFEDQGKKYHEIQVKTARGKNAAFGLRRLQVHGLENPNRIYVFIYAPGGNVKWCWVITEQELQEKRNKKKDSVVFSTSEHTNDWGSPYRCEPKDLFEKILEKTGN